MAGTPDGARRSERRPRRSRKVLALGWLVVIAAAAVIPYWIAQATHDKTETTTTAVGTPTPIPSNTAVVSGASAAPVSTTPSTSPPPPTASGSATTTPPAATPTTGAPVTGAPTPVAPSGGNGSVPTSPVPAVVNYTVKAGDSLWSIATSRGASGTAAIAAKVDEIYAANRTVIGSNPSLLRPGQVLTLSS